MLQNSLQINTFFFSMENSSLSVSNSYDNWFSKITNEFSHAVLLKAKIASFQHFSRSFWVKLFQCWMNKLSPWQ